ncbi:MAG: hypothetical protein EAZ89_02685, partial [Bacteroidetes bacterium]
MKTVTFLFILLLTSQLFAQPASVWTGVVPNISDKVGSQALDAVSDQVAWGISQKYTPTDSLYFFEDSSRVWFVRTTNGGLTWSADTLPITGSPFLSTISAVDSQRAWVTGVDFYTFAQFVLKTTDGGQTWSTVTLPGFNLPGGFVNNVFFTNAQEGYALGDPSHAPTDTTFHFEVLRTSDGGTTWARAPRSSALDGQPNEYGLFNVYESVGDWLWFMSTNGRVFRSKNKGLSWESFETGYFASIQSISFADTSVGVFGGFDYFNNKVAVYFTRDGGENWVDIAPADSQYLPTSITMIPGSGVIVLVLRNSNLTGPFKTWVSKNRGISWLEIGLGENAGWAEFLDENTAFAGEWQNPNSKGKYYRYTGSPLLGIFGHSALDATLSLAPNPTRDYAEVTVTASQPGQYVLLLHDLQGRLLYQTTSEVTALWSTRLDLGALPAGVYSVTV